MRIESAETLFWLSGDTFQIFWKILTKNIFLWKSLLKSPETLSRQIFWKILTKKFFFWKSLLKSLETLWRQIFWKILTKKFFFGKSLLKSPEANTLANPYQKKFSLEILTKISGDTLETNILENPYQKIFLWEILTKISGDKYFGKSLRGVTILSKR